MDIQNLPPELQEEFRRNFPELTTENTSYSTITEEIPIQSSESTEDPNSHIEEAEILEDVILQDDIQNNEVIRTVEPDLSLQAIFDNVTANNTDFLEAVSSMSTTELSHSENNNIEDVDEEYEVVEVKDQYSRFKGADWFNIVQQQDIILAGLGGIGSYVSLFLSRLGPKNLYLFDDDLFEYHNMSGQFVSVSDLGTHKVSAAQKHAQNFSSFTPSIFPTKYIKGEAITEKIMICGFDNMKARNDFYYSWKDSINPGKEKEYLFIDGRLLAEEFQILVLTGDDIFYQEIYEKEYLFSDNEVTDVDCTLKQTSHMAGMIASYMVTYFINFCNNLSDSNFPRRLPFFTHYNSLMNSYEHRY